MKTYFRLSVTLLCLFSARADAKEFTFDFSSQRMDNASATVHAFAIGDTINLSLSNGQPPFSLRIVAAPPAGIAGPSYIAKDVQCQASAVVKPTKDGLHIMVDDFAGNRMHVFRIKDGQKTYAVHEKSIEPDECATCAAASGGDGITRTTNSADAKLFEAPAIKSATLQSVGFESDFDSSSACVDTLLSPLESEFLVARQKAVVDVLVAFDKGAKAWAENSANWDEGDTIEEFADYAVNKMNMVLEQSQLFDTFCYRLVGVVEVDATYTTIGDPLLRSLGAGEGALAAVSEMRRKCGADTTTLLIDRTIDTVSGIAYVYRPGNVSSFAADNRNCNACDIKTVYSRYTMSHETGHNMGCGHSDRQGADNSGGGFYDYACGYHFQDAAGMKRHTVMAYSNTDPPSGTYYPVPYFSSPEIMPEELGVFVGTPTNDNRRTLLQTCDAVSDFAEHVNGYDWDVRFLDDNGDEIPSGTYFFDKLYVTLTNANPNATIYYTYDGTTPRRGSFSCLSGQRLTLMESKTITACAVVDGVAQSVRTVAFKVGQVWSGEAGRNGSGAWTYSALAWDGSSHAYDEYTSVVFRDISGIAAATATVHGVVAPPQSDFIATKTAYTFERGTANALLRLRDADFAPDGDLTFNLPVDLAAYSFTSPANHTVTFNAPFGQTVDATKGNCTNQIVIGGYGTLVVAPGVGKTQTFDSFNNTGNYYNTATLQIGEGTVMFNGKINRGKGLFGSTKIAVCDGGSLVFDVAGATGYDISSTLTVAKGGSVTFNEMEHMNRKLILDGGTIRCKRLDWMNGTTISATGDSSILENGSGGYVLIRYANATVDVSDGATLTLDVPITTGSNTENYGFVKKGGGELLANKSMSHTGATVISNGTVSVGYVSSARVGLGWTVLSGATLKVKDGCSLTVPTLTLEGGATLALPATNAAPLSATNNVSVAGVAVVLSNATNLVKGVSYPLLASEGDISGAENVDMTRLPSLAYGLEWKMEVADGTLFARVVDSIVQIAVARGETLNLSDIPATVTSVIGEGTIYCGATLPDASLGWSSADWKGTLVFEGLRADNSTKDFQFERYGNSASRIRLRNCAISYLKNNNATFEGMLALEQDNNGHVAFTTGNGYSETYNVFGALEGDGVMSFTTGQRQGYVFGTATNYSGSISVGAQNNSGIVGGRYIVFGAVASAGDLPANTNSATITVKSGATASIGGGATWYAYHGVDVSGTLLVKGANATLDCHVLAAMGLKLDDGATLRFEAADAKLTFAKAPQFAVGTVSIAFASGVSPQGGTTLVAWPANAALDGAFTFADATLATAWELCKTATGLVVKPKNRFDIPDSSAYLVESEVADWLDDQNFWIYEENNPGATWIDFLGDVGANGYTNWVNFAFGLSSEDQDDTFKVSIRMENGKVVISPCKPVYGGLQFTTTLYGADAISGSLPELGTIDGAVLELDPFIGSNAGFYKVKVSVKGQ